MTLRYPALAPVPPMTTGAKVRRDIAAGLVVFLVALPLCLGIATASGAPLISGIVAGIIGGIVVGAISGSQSSVSGPAAGLTAVVLSQISSLGSFEAFLVAVFLGGVFQVILGMIRAGALAEFVPFSVIKGLLAAIGAILILKQLPHLVGHDTDPEGESSFFQPDGQNTFSELVAMVQDLHPGAMAIGIASLALLLFWDRCKPLKNSLVPAPIVVVLLGVLVNLLFHHLSGTLGSKLPISGKHLVDVPVADTLKGTWAFLATPDFSIAWNTKLLMASLTIALVASLETLLNIEAVDKIDPEQRTSPPNRELVAQGVGNMLCGLCGGLPVTSVIVRSSVNINVGAKTKLSAILHGFLLLGSVVFLPQYLNMIPLSALAAILIHTGFKLASPQLFKQMWKEGRYQFLPFIVTLLAILLTDLLIGVLIGLGVSLGFILYSNLRRPVRRILERHIGGDVLHIELPTQVSFLNKAALDRIFREAKKGEHLLIDARRSDYIDPDILSLIREFRDQMGPVHGVYVSVRGFRPKYQIRDEVLFVDYSTRELQEKMTARDVLKVLIDGNERFRTGHRIERDPDSILGSSGKGQHPIAVIFSCIDSRTPAETIFDLGLGDIFSVRIAGNIISRKVLGSIEYGTSVAGAKLVLVLGHTRCGAVTAAVSLAGNSANIADKTGCEHLESIVDEIHRSVDLSKRPSGFDPSTAAGEEFVDDVARQNVISMVKRIATDSSTMARVVASGQVAVVGAMYDVASGEIEFLTDHAIGFSGPSSLSEELT